MESNTINSTELSLPLNALSDVNSLITDVMKMPVFGIALPFSAPILTIRYFYENF